MALNSGNYGIFLSMGNAGLLYIINRSSNFFFSLLQEPLSASKAQNPEAFIPETCKVIPYTVFAVTTYFFI